MFLWQLYISYMFVLYAMFPNFPGTDSFSFRKQLLHDASFLWDHVRHEISGGIYEQTWDDEATNLGNKPWNNCQGNDYLIPALWIPGDEKGWKMDVQCPYLSRTKSGLFCQVFGLKWNQTFSSRIWLMFSWSVSWSIEKYQLPRWTCQQTPCAFCKCFEIASSIAIWFVCKYLYVIVSWCLKVWVNELLKLSCLSLPSVLPQCLEGVQVTSCTQFLGMPLALAIVDRFR